MALRQVVQHVNLFLISKLMLKKVMLSQIITYFLVGYKERDAKPNHLQKFSFNWILLLNKKTLFLMASKHYTKI
jgi:hypothetical protein